MFKKLVIGLLLVVGLAAAFAGWCFFTANTAFTEESKYLYIYTTHATYPDLLQTIKDSNYIKSPGAFDFLARRMDLPEKIKPGRYEITHGMSLMDIVRMLRNGRQAPVRLTITKLRTKEDLASLISKKLECDSNSVMQFINNPDTVKSYGLDTSNIMAMIYPNTYMYFWDTSPRPVFEKLYSQFKKVWTPERKELAQQHGLTPVTAYILASIVEEETSLDEDKGNISSVYLNRLHKGMRLQADPTVKFALREFGLKRIYEKHLLVESPYNTYRINGFPPGPICTPSMETLDAVLKSPQTNYLYFVAKSDFSGHHVFSETYEQHLLYAKEFQKAQDVEKQKREAAGSLR
jgi:UPF0755 protein